MYNHMVVREAEIDRVFHALADPTRRDIVARVIQHEQSVSALARHFPMKQRRGREQIVHGNVPALGTAARLLEAYEQLWRDRARGIEQLLSEGR